MLDINWTLFIQIANFLLLLFFLNVLLFKPIRSVITQRKEEMDSLQEAIEDYQNRSDNNEKGIEEGMALARKEGFVEKEKFKDAGLGNERAILQEVNSSVEEKLGKARSEMEMKMSDVRKALEDQVAGFSEGLAEKILGRSV